MKFFYSLKYQIAATMFVVQLIVLGLILWQTQTTAFIEAKSLIRQQDQSVLKLLSNVSQTALFTEQYFQLQPFYSDVVESTHISSAVLRDYLGVVVASSDKSLLGLNNEEAEAATSLTYLLIHTFDNADDDIGQLSIQFSHAELDALFTRIKQRAITIGLIGALLSMLMSILLAKLLTHRLDQIRIQTVRFAEGDFESRCNLKGADELSSLSDSFNIMADKISGSMKEIEHLAFHDALTGLANRREFDKRLELALSSAKEHGHFYALLCLDLDKFKVVNDTCGHHAGDQLLIQLSDVMLNVLRNRDTLVRFGGDEFAILLENCSLSQAKEVSNKILKAVYDFKFSWDDKIMQVGVSIGAVTLNKHTTNLEQLLSTADAACYTAKQQGRNQVHLVMPGDSNIEGHFTDVDWINRLSTMIDKNQFSMAFQLISPTQKASDGLVRMEFLLRMQDKGEWISPAVFIDAAERFDFIQRLDRYVIDKVFKIIASGKVPGEEVMCFINLSGKSISEEGLFNFVRDKMAHYGLNAKQICFEITETAAIANFNHASVFIEKARGLGCSFASDDFGSGMCSFSYLKNLQVDYVKIDGSFILNMANNAVDTTIVQSINKISHQAGFKTIAEFVENKEILDSIGTMGIDFAQGYGIHKPEIIKEV